MKQRLDRTLRALDQVEQLNADSDPWIQDRRIANLEFQSARLAEALAKLVEQKEAEHAIG